MKTIIVKPNGKNTQYANLKSLSAVELPLWHCIFANYYKADVVLDAEADDLNEHQTIEKILSYNPDRVIILGTGSHPSAFIQQKQEVIKLDCMLTSKVKEIIPLTKLPTSPIKWNPPRYDLIDLNKYKAHNWLSWSNDCVRSPYGVVYTSIGCPFKCKFCTIKSFYGKIYECRLVEDIIADFKVMGQNNVRNIKIMDELFILNKNRTHLICDKIIDLGYDFNIWTYARIDIMDEKLLKKLKKVGVNWLAYGIETGNDEIRKSIMKGNFNKSKIKDIIKMTKDNGIYIVGNFMFGFWEDNLDTMKETLDFAIELNCEYANFYCTVAYPDSELYEEMREKGVSLPTDYTQYAQMSPNFKPLPTKYLSAKDVLKFRDSAFLQYYNNVNYLSMMKEAFGQQVLEEILKMVKIPLRRNY